MSVCYTECIMGVIKSYHIYIEDEAITHVCPMYFPELVQSQREEIMKKINNSKVDGVRIIHPR